MAIDSIWFAAGSKWLASIIVYACLHQPALLGTRGIHDQARLCLSVPARVGDTLRFGTSSRLYVVGGPEELRPEEGLTASAKAKLAALEHLAQMKEKDKQVGDGGLEAGGCG
jgi:hypothetical protein